MGCFSAKPRWLQEEGSVIIDLWVSALFVHIVGRSWFNDSQTHSKNICYKKGNKEDKSGKGGQSLLFSEVHNKLSHPVWSSQLEIDAIKTLTCQYIFDQKSSGWGSEVVFKPESLLWNSLRSNLCNWFITKPWSPELLLECVRLWARCVRSSCTGASLSVPDASLTAQSSLFCSKNRGTQI